jgi:proteasome lid subunit RPN8/RPN11
MITEEIISAVFAHAEEEQPRECCGLISRDAEGVAHYVRSTNARQGKDSFEITGDCWAAAEDVGEVVGVAHSHAFVSPDPSQADLVGCEKSGLPWLIVNYPTRNWRYIEPSGYRPPLEGRAWCHGALDCYALVRDYYAQECGILLRDYEREDDWWFKGKNLYRENFAKEGFVQVDGEPRRHDLLLMMIRAPVENHAAVYLGDGKMLHHLFDRLSRKEMWGGWRKFTTAILRHESML